MEEPLTSGLHQARVATLLARLRAGEPAARVELFQLLGKQSRFREALVYVTRDLLSRHHLARRLIDTDDVLQSVLRTGLVELSRFQGSSEGELFVWLRRIVRTKVCRVARRDDRPLKEKAAARAIERQDAQDSRLPIATIIDSELQESLHAAIARLPSDQRLVVELRLSGSNSRDIAEQLGLQENTIRKRESRAVQELRRLFSQQSP